MLSRNIARPKLLERQKLESWGGAGSMHRSHYLLFFLSLLVLLLLSFFVVVVIVFATFWSGKCLEGCDIPVEAGSDGGGVVTVSQSSFFLSLSSSSYPPFFLYCCCFCKFLVRQMSGTLFRQAVVVVVVGGLLLSSWLKKFFLMLNGAWVVCGAELTGQTKCKGSLNIFLFIITFTCCMMNERLKRSDCCKKLVHQLPPVWQALCYNTLLAL